MTVRIEEVDQWLDELRHRRWLHVYLPDRKAPQVVASISRWPGGADVVALFTEAEALAYRASTGVCDDPFKPTSVTWVYAGPPTWTIRAVLALPPPGHPGEPRFEQDPPPLCRVLADLAGRARVTRLPW